MSKLLPLLLATVLATAVVFCTSAISIHSARSPTARFGAYRTFAFDPVESAPSRYARSARSEEVRNRVKQQASKLLETKGYAVAVDGKPDLIVRVAAGRREQEISHPHPGPRWLEEDEEEDFIEGAFVIDAFDGATDELAWHGSARAEVDPNKIDEERLRRAVASVLATFPGRAAEVSR
ncbi:MAG TPA: DUF4136 domain-containing protein [Polyangiaceae bacterium]|nr:DUF4136 domain-containing protein [Polyangiaceae bacterium]